MANVIIDKAKNNQHNDGANADQLLRKLLATAAERVFESGIIIKRIREQRYYEILGYPTFEAYLDALQSEKVIARSTAYSNMRIAETFVREQHASVGIGRLRVLLDAPDPVGVLEDGLDVPDGNGGYVHKEIKDLKCRDLKRELKRRKAESAPMREDGEARQLQADLLAATSSLMVPGLADQAPDAGPRNGIAEFAADDDDQPYEFGDDTSAELPVDDNPDEESFYAGTRVGGASAMVPPPDSSVGRRIGGKGGRPRGATSDLAS